MKVNSKNCWVDMKRSILVEELKLKRLELDIHDVLFDYGDDASFLWAILRLLRLNSKKFN